MSTIIRGDIQFIKKEVREIREEMGVTNTHLYVITEAIREFRDIVERVAKAIEDRK